jgi:archaellum component FlaC
MSGMDEDVHAEAQELRSEIQQLRDEVRDLRSALHEVGREARSAREDHLERIEALEREVLPGQPGDEVGLP